MGSHEIVEHTADVGVRATGDTPAEVFVQAALGLLEITGAGGGGSDGDIVGIRLEGAPDLGALLVDWLSEILYLQDAHDRTIADVSVDTVDDNGLVGQATVHARISDIEGTPVKAVTFHQLVVGRRDGVWNAQVFFDI